MIDNVLVQIGLLLRRRDFEERESRSWVALLAILANVELRIAVMKISRSDDWTHAASFALGAFVDNVLLLCPLLVFSLSFDSCSGVFLVQHHLLALSNERLVKISFASADQAIVHHHVVSVAHEAARSVFIFVRQRIGNVAIIDLLLLLLLELFKHLGTVLVKLLPGIFLTQCQNDVLRG